MFEEHPDQEQKPKEPSGELESSMEFNDADTGQISGEDNQNYTLLSQGENEVDGSNETLIEEQLGDPVNLSGSEIAQATGSESPKTQYQKRRVGSVFFPLLLIVAGVILLLSNLGITSQSAWSILISLWPVLFIAWGLDAIWKSEGLTGAVFLLGIGIVFLLGNFGYLSFSPWQVLLAIWPVLLVAIGVDVIIGKRRTIWTSLLGFLFITVVMIGSLWLAGIRLPGNAAVTGEPISYATQGSDQGIIQLSPGVASLAIKPGTEDDVLLSGTIPESTRAQTITQQSQVEGGVIKVTLQSGGYRVFIPWGETNLSTWDLEISPSIPVNLNVNMGAGDAKIDMNSLLISGLSYEAGIGQVKLSLPEAGSFSGKVSSAIGQITLVVPDEVGLQIETGTALVVRSIPANYIKIAENLYRSPNYDMATSKINLQVDLAIGQILVQEK